jgi:NADH-ubiquinone oxidoreductase chain 1
LLPIFIIFLIGSIAETNRAPFDLAEAESELVSGFMTEHAAVIFVFFFLAEYASILLICILTSILFLGGYLFDVTILLDSINYVYFNTLHLISYEPFTYVGVNNYAILSNPLVEGTMYGITLGLKSCVMVFIFI